MDDVQKVLNIISFVERHTDEQCGLDVANVQVFQIHDMVQICVTRKKDLNKGIEKRIKVPGHSDYGMKEEWRGQAEDLIDEIGKDPRADYGGLGIPFELHRIYDTGFHLWEILDKKQ